MPLYEDRTNAENKIRVKPETKSSVVAGNTEVTKQILNIIEKQKAKAGQPFKIAIDAWYGVDWETIITLFKDAQAQSGLNFCFESFTMVFKKENQIKDYNKKFLTDDPAFGWSNTEGLIMDIIDSNKLEALKEKIRNNTSADIIIVYGYGATIAELKDEVDIRFYADMTQQQLLGKCGMET